jgi:hypothetical protein
MVLDFGVVLLLNRAGNQKKVVEKEINNGDKSASTSSNGGEGDVPISANPSKANASCETNHNPKKKD